MSHVPTTHHGPKPRHENHSQGKVELPRTGGGAPPASVASGPAAKAAPRSRRASVRNGQVAGSNGGSVKPSPPAGGDGSKVDSKQQRSKAGPAGGPRQQWRPKEQQPVDGTSAGGVPSAGARATGKPADAPASVPPQAPVGSSAPQKPRMPRKQRSRAKAAPAGGGGGGASVVVPSQPPPARTCSVRGGPAAVPATAAAAVPTPPAPAAAAARPRRHAGRKHVSGARPVAGVPARAQPRAAGAHAPGAAAATLLPPSADMPLPAPPRMARCGLPPPPPRSPAAATVVARGAQPPPPPPWQPAAAEPAAEAAAAPTAAVAAPPPPPPTVPAALVFTPGGDAAGVRETTPLAADEVAAEVPAAAPVRHNTFAEMLAQRAMANAAKSSLLAGSFSSCSSGCGSGGSTTAGRSHSSAAPPVAQPTASSSSAVAHAHADSIRSASAVSDQGGAFARPEHACARPRLVLEPRSLPMRSSSGTRAAAPASGVPSSTSSDSGDALADYGSGSAASSVSGGGAGGRPRLHLLPRSAGSAAPGSLPAAGGGARASSVFGAAKPREEVLKQRGLDPAVVEAATELRRLQAVAAGSYSIASDAGERGTRPRGSNGDGGDGWHTVVAGHGRRGAAARRLAEEEQLLVGAADDGFNPFFAPSGGPQRAPGGGFGVAVPPPTAFERDIMRAGRGVGWERHQAPLAL